MTSAPTIWHGCYDDSWKGHIVDEAFAHPAKYARGLVNRIFDYLFAREFIHHGELVADPFGGIGTGGIVAASRGVRWLGCELEAKFVSLARQNFELHRRVWEVAGDPLPVIVQGDSRKLREVLGIADCVVSSPPYAESMNSETHGIDFSKAAKDYPGRVMHGSRIAMLDGNHAERRYGDSPGQLGSMPPGSVDAVLASPPWEASTNGTDAEFMERMEAEQNPGPRAVGRRTAPQDYGDSPEQLGNSTGETFWTAARDIVAECFAILKPGGVAVWVVKGFVRNKQLVDFPADWRKLCEHCGFVMVEEIHASLVKESRNADLFGGEHVKRTERKSFFRRLAEKKGSPRIDFETVLVMAKPEGDGGGIDAVISSPPFSERQPPSNARPGEETELKKMLADCYGATPGQLGGMKPGSVDDVTGKLLTRRVRRIHCIPPMSRRA